jgi:hypothetical protein
MKSMEIYFSDLTKDAQERFVKTFGEDGNRDLIPIAVFETEDDENDE